MVAFTQWACFASLLVGVVEAKVDHNIPGALRREDLNPRSVSGIKASAAPSSFSKAASLPSLSVPSRPSSTKVSGASASSKYKASSVPEHAFEFVATSSADDTCSGKTLNVLQASLDWWYPQTYTYIASTFVVQYDSAGSATGWALEPAATPFDVTSAVNSPKCPPLSDGPSKTCTSTPPPVAASTTVITETAYSTITATSGTGSVPYLAVTPTPAAITIPSSGGNFAAGTPFVFFSAYEILTKSPTTYAGNHSVGCATATTTYQMTAPFSFEYTGADVNGSVVVNAGVTGDVAPAFLGVVNVISVLAGSWVAAPTVVVVVSKVVAVSQSALATPTPTLLSGYTSNGSPATGSLTPGQPAVASSQLSLQLPSSASSSTSGATVPQTSPGGVGSPVSSRPSSTTTTSPTNALGVLTAALNTFPTNALGVLSEAEWTFPAAAASSSSSSSGSSGSSSGGNVPNNKAVSVPVLTFAGSTMTANAASAFLLAGGSATLTPGGPAVTVDGTTVSMATGGSVVVVNGVSETLSRTVVVSAGGAAVSGSSSSSTGSGSGISIAPGSGGKTTSTASTPTPQTGGGAGQRSRFIADGTWGYGLTGLCGAASFALAVLL